MDAACIVWERKWKRRGRSEEAGIRSDDITLFTATQPSHREEWLSTLIPNGTTPHSKRTERLRAVVHPSHFYAFQAAGCHIHRIRNMPVCDGRLHAKVSLAGHRDRQCSSLREVWSICAIH